MVYACSGQLKCFQCGDVGHKRFAKGQGVFSSLASCEGEDMEYDSESDRVSIGETSNRITDLYSLEEIN